MGVGHVPAGQVCLVRAGRHVQGRQRRRAARKGALTIDQRSGQARPTRRQLGVHGEQLAAQWYEQQGYQVLARNWRSRLGELDLVVQQGRTLVFCEVKTRSTDAFGLPAEAVDRAKQARIRRLAAQWIDAECVLRPRQIRFDVVAVLDGVVEVLEGVF